MGSIYNRFMELTSCVAVKFHLSPISFLGVWPTITGSIEHITEQSITILIVESEGHPAQEGEMWDFMYTALHSWTVVEEPELP